MVGSTDGGVDARVNTDMWESGSHKDSGSSIPIYWLNGNKVADSYSDFYDDSWDDETQTDESGGALASSLKMGSIWTGTNGMGAVSGLFGLGSTSLLGVTVGSLDAFDSYGPLFAAGETSTTTLPFYSISPVFVVESPPAGVSVSESSLSLTELGAANLVEKTYTVVLDTDPGANVVITATVPGANTSDAEIKTGSASFGSSATLTFTPGSGGNWSSAQTVTVRAKNDGDAANESFNITHAAAVSTDSNNPYHQITISNVAVTTTDAGHGVVVTESMLSVAENDETATYDIVLKSQPGGTVEISVTSGTTASAIVSHSTLSFNDTTWPTPQTVTVTGKGQGSSTITHSVTAGTTDYSTSTSISSVSVTVTAATSHTVSVSVVADAVEGDAGHTDKLITIMVSPPRSSGFPIDFCLSGTATYGGASRDYEIVDGYGGGQSAGFQNGCYTGGLTLSGSGLSSNDQLRIRVRGDSEVEGDETVIVTLKARSGSTRSTPSDVGISATNGAATYTIKNDDTAGVIITETGDSTAVTEGGAGDSYTVRLNAEPAHNVTVTVSAGSGVTVGSQMLTFSAAGANIWSTAKTVTVAAAADSADDSGSARTVEITHTSSSSDSRFNGLTIDSVSVGVTDNDPTTVVLTTPDTTAEEGNANATAEITLTLGRGLVNGESLVVPLGFSGGTVGTHFTLVCPGSPPAGVSCQTLGTSPQVTFTGPSSGVSATAVTLTFSASEDLNSAGETVTVSIPASSTGNAPILTAAGLAGGASGSRTGNGQITIQDNDTAGISVSETSGTTVVGESGTSDTYSIVLNTQPMQNVTVTVTADAGLRVNKVGGSVGGTQTLTFTNSNYGAAQTITVTATDNNTDDNTGRAVDITHSSASTDVSYNNITISPASVTVIDNDPTAVTLGGSGTVAEDGSNSADVTVTLGRNLIATETVTAPLAVTGTGIVAGDYTIRLKSGANLNSGVTLSTTAPHSAAVPAVVFAGHGTDTVQVATLEVLAQHDTDDEGASEALTVGFGSVTSNLDRADPATTGAGGTTATGTAVVTITDDDTSTSPGVTITETVSTSVSEDGTTTTDTYEIVLKTQPTHAVTVTVTADTGVQVNKSGGNAAGSQTLTFNPSGSSNLWSTAQTITVTGVNDDIDNANDARTVNIAHAATSTDNNYEISNAGEVSVTVTDDDTAGVTISEDERMVMENGGVASYTVRLATQPLNSVRITVTSGNDSLVKLDGPDSSTAYTDTEDLMFTTSNWGNEQTVTIQGQDDNVINNPAARTVTVSHVIKSGNGDGSRYMPNTPSIGGVIVTVSDDDTGNGGTGTGGGGGPIGGGGPPDDDSGTDNQDNADSAVYIVTFSGNWTTDSTPGGVADNAHFTTLIGAVHNSDVTFWRTGDEATAGVEDVAESGTTNTFESEIADAGADVRSEVKHDGNTSATAERTFEVELSRNHPLFTLLSMIGPSPDWFVGVSGLSLLDEQEEWYPSHTVDLFAYDAGTEDGEDFSLDGSATVPQGTITSLKEQGRFSDVPMARLSFSLKTDRDSLLAVYRASGGNNWTRKDNWNSDELVSEWYGVTTDQDGRVTELRLGDNNLSGTVHEDIAELEKLEVLYLDGNPDLGGELPRGLMDLAALAMFDISASGVCPPDDEGFRAWLMSLASFMDDDNCGSVEMESDTGDPEADNPETDEPGGGGGGCAVASGGGFAQSVYHLIPAVFTVMMLLLGVYLKRRQPTLLS